MKYQLDDIAEIAAKLNDLDMSKDIVPQVQKIVRERSIGKKTKI